MVRSEDLPVLPSSLEARLAELTARTRVLEARMDALEGLERREPDTPQAPVPAMAEAGEPGPSITAVVALVGRACLMLGGAFLIRTSTDSGWLPPLAGVGLGLAYSVLWAWSADRSASRGQSAWAAIQILTAAVTTFPMLWETTIRFQFLAPASTAGALLGSTLLFLGVAMRHRLHKVAWLVVLGALGTAFVLMAGSSAITTFCAFCLLLGAASLLASDSPEWKGLRWPAALSADLAVALMTMLALAPGSSEALVRDLTPARVLPLALALVVVYLGAILFRTLKRPKAVGGFEVFQALMVLALGYGGAIRVAHATGAGVPILGVAALVLGLGCYACAFAFVERQAEGSLDFQFLTGLALVLILSGALLLLGGPALAALCLALGVGSTLLGLRFQRSSLNLHGALYLSAAALGSGLLGSAWAALVVDPQPTAHRFSLTALATLAALAAGHLLPRREALAPPAPPQRLASLTLGALGVFALGGLLAALLAPLVKGDPGGLAALRTAVLVALALGAAALGRWKPLSEVPWLAYPLLGLTCLKMLLEDFPHGRPATLFLALTLLGCGLLAVGRLTRATVLPPGPGKS
jgi:hypothetical protein